MAAAFKDLDEFFDATLKLPVGGKTYVIPPPSAEVGLLCQRLMQAGLAAHSGRAVDAEGINELAQVVLDDDQEKDLYQTILGPVWDELLADKVSWPAIQHVGQTALIWVAAGLDAAAQHWESGPGKRKPRLGRQPRRRNRPEHGAPRLVRPGRRPLGQRRPGRVARSPDQVGARRGRSPQRVRGRPR
ncbi:hypothetical protein ACFQYP_00470 [Nonomuraea antimicrobica]